LNRGLIFGDYYFVLHFLIAPGLPHAEKWVVECLALQGTKRLVAESFVVSKVLRYEAHGCVSLILRLHHLLFFFCWQRVYYPNLAALDQEEKKTSVLQAPEFETREIPYAFHD